MNVKTVLLVPLMALAAVGAPCAPAHAQAIIAVAPPALPESLLEYVPEQASAALVLRSSALGQPRAWLDKMPELRADLSAYLQRLWGVDLTRMEGLVVFSNNLSEKPTYAMVLRVPQAGPLKGKRLKRVLGVDLIDLGGGMVAASVKGGLALGNEGEVQSVIALGRGKGRPLAPSSRLQALLSPESREADLAAAVYAPAVDDKDLRQGVEQFGIQTATLHYRKGGLITLAVSGEPDKLAQAKALLQLGMTAGVAKLKTERDEALKQNDPAEALPKIAAYHYAQALLREIEPRLTGDRLISQYQLPQLDDPSGAVISLMGVMAAVAVPSFARYTARAKAAKSEVRPEQP